MESSAQVLPSLEKRLLTRPQPEASERRTYFDTFDERLRVRREELFQTGVEDERRTLWVSPARGTAEVDLDGTDLGFVQTLGEGRVRDRLEEILAPRKLLPTVVVETRSRRIDVLDELEKTVVRIDVRDARARRAESDEEWKMLPGCWVVRPVLGFDDEFEEVVEFLSGSGAREEEPVPLVELALESVGVSHAPPTVKSLRLDPDVPAALGLQAILARHGEIMVANEPGLRDDVDSEFLHDFRVAVRRTRALLSQVRGVLAERATELYKRDFKWLGTVTGPVRDLDVMLLRLHELEKHMAPELLAPLVARLEREREQEQEKLFETLDSPRYKELLRAWRAFTTQPLVESAVGERGEDSLRSVLSRRIWKLYRKIRGRADSVATASDELLHEVRLDCKKLRYLIEAARLVLGDDVAPTQKALRKLQNVLGDVNDCAVQTATLERYARDIDSASPEPLLAIGGLIERIRIHGDEARALFDGSYERFCSDKTRTLFRSLYGGGKP